MAAARLLEAIRARAATRGMTLTDLARAARVQPGNLRRMLASNAGSPRLGSVMRLLGPLHCRIAPADARTAAELAVFLEDLRRRNGLGWEQFLESSGLHADKVAASFASSPEKLPLDLVMRLAAALHVELEIVDDEAPTSSMVKRPTTRPARAPRSPASRKAHSAAASSPKTSDEPPADGPLPPPQATDVAKPATASSPVPSGLPPLRPPRLGRYRDAPPTCAASHPPPVPWIPPGKPHALESAVLASISSEHWSDGFAFVWGMLRTGVELPTRFLDRLGTMTAAAFQRSPGPRDLALETPGPPEPPAGCFDALDAGPLVHFWRASQDPDYRPTDTMISYDELGMLAFHLSLDKETGVRLQLSPRGHSHRIIEIIHLPRSGPPEPQLSQDVALEIGIEGQRRSFEHVRAGPVFGELVVGERVYLVAAISNLLALIEVRADVARVIWGGRAENLPEVVLETEAEVASPSEGEVDQATPSASEATLPEVAARLHFHELTARLEAEARARGAAEAALDAAQSDRISAQRDRLALEAALTAERAAREEDQRARLGAEHELAAAREALGASQRAAAGLQAEYDAQLEMARQLFGETSTVLSRMNETREQAITAAREAWQARDILVARIHELQHERDNASAAEAEVRQNYVQILLELDSERQRRLEAEAFVDAVAVQLDALESELAAIRGTAPPRERAQRAVTERLVEAQAELSELRQTQVDRAVAAPGSTAARTSPIHPAAQGASDKLGDAFDLFGQAPLKAPANPSPDRRGQLLSPVPASRTIGRNERCPCGSGKKYKVCCWRRAGG